MKIEVLNVPNSETFGNLENGAVFLLDSSKEVYVKTLSFGDPSGQFNTIVLGTGRRIGIAAQTKVRPAKRVEVQL